MEQYRITHLEGRCRTGSDRVGKITHLVSNYIALCGARPGKHSGGWSEYNDKDITCPKCSKRLEEIMKAGG